MAKIFKMPKITSTIYKTFDDYWKWCVDMDIHSEASRLPLKAAWNEGRKRPEEKLEKALNHLVDHCIWCSLTYNANCNECHMLKALSILEEK